MAKVLELRPDRSLLLRAGVGWRPGLVGHATVPVGRDSQAGHTLVSSEPLVVTDLATEPRFSGPALLLDHGVRSGISVTIPGETTPWGVLGIHSTSAAHFTRDDVSFVQAMANLVGAKLRESNARAAQHEAEARLALWQKMEAIGTLAGGIAHDFNNLLTAILSYADLALDALPEGSPVRADLEQIVGATQRAGELTSQILAFGRKQVLRPRNTDLNLVVESTLRLLRRTLGEQVELDFVPGAALGHTFVDPTQMEQVILNLCVNARDAMPDGGRISIETQNVVINGEYVRAHPWAKPGRYVMLTVADTGVGMSREIVDRIFEPFFTTKELGRGTGLGLASVHGIVHQHGGMIQVYSEVGRGTLFKVYLPITSRAAHATERRPAGPRLRGSETILVAEDDPHVQRVVIRILQSAGYETVAAPDGEALEIFRAAAPSIDLVILDAVMPRVGGRQALREMRAIRPDLRFLLVSGYSDLTEELDPDERRAWVTKPYDPDSLLERVRRALDGTLE